MNKILTLIVTALAFVAGCTAWILLLFTVMAWRYGTKAITAWPEESANLFTPLAIGPGLILGIALAVLVKYEIEK